MIWKNFLYLPRLLKNLKTAVHYDLLMIIRPKHYLLFILGSILSSYIFYVNRSWGNPIGRCIYLSTFTFLFWWCCWSLYFELRDIWQFRWYGGLVNLMGISVNSVSIPLKQTDKDIKKGVHRDLYGEILHHPKTNPQSPIVIFIHGFSDDSTYIRHLLVPLALSFDVLAYDNRGTAGSRRAGNKNQFSEIVKDLADVIDFARTHSTLGQRPIHLVGISLGAVAAIRQGIDPQKTYIKKVIAIAGIANYLDVLPQSPVAFKKQWYLWLRYNFFGVPINPLPAINKEISPLLHLQHSREAYGNSVEFSRYLNRTLYLIHAKNDPIVSVSHFNQNRDSAQLTFSNWLLARSGGHNLVKYETILTAAIIAKLREKSD